MKVSMILSLLAVGGSALSAPNAGNELGIRSRSECKSVAAILSILSQYEAAATSFCSSFLSIPLKTATSTNVVTLASKISTVTQIETIIPEISVTATTTVTPTFTYIHARDLGFQNRDTPPLPTYLTTFPSSKISSACSCLSITPSTTTIKSVSTITVPASTTTLKATITNPPITTTISTITITASTTVTECDQPQPTFILKMATSVVVNGTQLQGTYGTNHQDYEDEGIRIDRLAFNGLTDPVDAGSLYLSFSILVNFASGFEAVRLGNETGVQAIHFEDPELLGTTDTADACGIEGAVLACTRPDGAMILQLCHETTGFSDVYVGPTVGSGCTQVVLDVVPICTPPPAS